MDDTAASCDEDAAASAAVATATATSTCAFAGAAPDEDPDEEADPTDGPSSLTAEAEVQQLQQKLKLARKKLRDSQKSQRDQEQKLENVKRGYKCYICFEPAQLLTMMPCGMHGTCFQCMVKHAVARTVFHEDRKHELGGYLVCSAVCPVCRRGEPLDDMLSHSSVPVPELRDFHYAYLKKAMTLCPYCSIAVTPNMSDDHIRHCPERKHPCPRKGCRVKVYRPSLGYKHHLENECTAFSCPSCKMPDLTFVDQTGHRRQHAEGFKVWESISSSVIELYALVEQRIPFMKLDHVQQVKQFLDSLNMVMTTGNNKLFDNGMKFAGKFTQQMIESAMHCPNNGQAITEFQDIAKYCAEMSALDEDSVQLPVSRRIYTVSTAALAAKENTANATHAAPAEQMLEE